MNTVLFYLLYPFIYLISIMPLGLMYRLSDITFVIIYHFLRYRKNVVLENLRNSFPEKSEELIRQICNNFYRYFCDLIFETIKTLTITPAMLKKQVLFNDLSVFEKYYREKQSVIVVMGHFGNWEYAGARFGIEKLHTLYVIYHPLTNKHFDRLLYHMRTRLGNKLYAMNDAVRGILRDRDKITATAFISDQSPSPDNAYWTVFLNQDTPVFTGTEKIAIKMRYPVIYISMKRIKRGIYNIVSEVLVSDPENIDENKISEMHTRRLEQDILEQPEIWLWTHRRWKHKRTPDNSIEAIC